MTHVSSLHAVLLGYNQLWLRQAVPYYDWDSGVTVVVGVAISGCYDSGCNTLECGDETLAILSHLQLWTDGALPF